MLTVFDILDGGLVAAVIATAFVCRASWAIPPVAGLVAYHAIGRWVAFQTADPLPLLAIMAFLTSLSFHFGAFFTIYARLIGTLFALISMSAAMGAWFGIVPQNGMGLALDVWNFQSLALGLIAILMIMGIVRHERLVARAGHADRVG